MTGDLKLFGRGILNSYSQVFFSDSYLFSLLLILVSFADFYAGLCGITAVLVTNCVGFMMGLDRKVVARGLYGFNSLLVGLGLGLYYEPGLVIMMVIVLGSVLTLFISVSLQGVLGKYGLPYLSVPFIIGAWIVTLATREFSSLGLSERGIFTFNELYTIGGSSAVRIFEWWNSIEFLRPLRIYFISLGAILFQYNILAGVIISLGLLLHSRISFTLSLMGFFTAYLFYEITGASISDLNYSYIGFNYILTSIAVGGFFIIPSWRSYLWAILLVPVVALITISFSSLFSVFKLPVYALPFNIIVLLFLYVLKFRVKMSGKLSEVFIQQNSPEKNLYSYSNDILRFRIGYVTVKLPFFGVWSVSQAHDGEYTHRGDWKHAWDFVILDKDNKQFRNKGDEVSDYYCYNKPVTAVADGTVVHIEDNIPDNVIGTPNIRENWGNTIIIQHNDYLYSSLSHLVPGSFTVKEGDRVRQGDPVAKCGNSGRSPYPHLHFQLQPTPYIGSKTLDYPLSYYISHIGDSFGLNYFEYPAVDDRISNIEVNELLFRAFDFIPGKEIRFNVNRNGNSFSEEWEVSTDEYNNPFIRCLGCGSVAWFKNDGTMLMFRHYEGRKDNLLYWFFMSAYKIQQGFYHDLVVKDSYPLNLFFRKSVLVLQDFLAPFVLFFSSGYTLTYKNIDSEISPSVIELEATASNKVFGIETRRVITSLIIGDCGIEKIRVEGSNINIEASCELS